MVASSLPLPRLAARTIDSIPIFTDDALYDASSVRIAFTGRAGGASEGDYASLNLGTHVGDDRDVVLGNRRALLCAFGEPDMPLVVPNQVHGTDLVDIETSGPEALRGIQDAADAGADGLVVSCPRVAALLCFADCVPVYDRIADGACGGGPRGLARSRGAYRLFSLQAPRRPRCARARS